MHAALARAVARRGEPFAQPCVILSGGETTVTVRGSKRAAAAAAPPSSCSAARSRCRASPACYVLAADTDGIDGIEDNAGAIVTPDTLARAARARPEGGRLPRPQRRLQLLLARSATWWSPGPTFTNVNDFRALLVLNP